MSNPNPEYLSDHPVIRHQRPRTSYAVGVRGYACFDKRLKAHHKCFLGRLVALSKQKGYCWASNETLAEEEGHSITSIQRWLGTLQAAGHIICTYKPAPEDARKTLRKIFVNPDVLEDNNLDVKKLPEYYWPVDPSYSPTSNIQEARRISQRMYRAELRAARHKAGAYEKGKKRNKRLADKSSSVFLCPNTCKSALQSTDSLAENTSIIFIDPSGINEQPVTAGAVSFEEPVHSMVETEEVSPVPATATAVLEQEEEPHDYAMQLFPETPDAPASNSIRGKCTTMFEGSREEMRALVRLAETRGTRLVGYGRRDRGIVVRKDTAKRLSESLGITGMLNRGARTKEACPAHRLAARDRLVGYFAMRVFGQAPADLPTDGRFWARLKRLAMQNKLANFEVDDWCTTAVKKSWHSRYEVFADYRKYRDSQRCKDVRADRQAALAERRHQIMGDFSGTQESVEQRATREVQQAYAARVAQLAPGTPLPVDAWFHLAGLSIYWDLSGYCWDGPAGAAMGSKLLTLLMLSTQHRDANAAKFREELWQVCVTPECNYLRRTVALSNLWSQQYLKLMPQFDLLTQGSGLGDIAAMRKAELEQIAAEEKE